jgi:hypothetical protein
MTPSTAPAIDPADLLRLGRRRSGVPQAQGPAGARAAGAAERCPPNPGMRALETVEAPLEVEAQDLW